MECPSISQQASCIFVKMDGGKLAPNETLGRGYIWPAPVSYFRGVSGSNKKPLPVSHEVQRAYKTERFKKALQVSEMTNRYWRNLAVSTY